jgi:hypothetical protein
VFGMYQRNSPINPILTCRNSGNKVVS